MSTDETGVRAPGPTPAERAARVKLRLRFAKLGKIRWTSHRDVARMWERAFRRVQLPLAYSEGFSPRPKVSFGLALPTGHESVAEYLDVELTGLDGVDLPTLTDRLSEALPVGVDATALTVLEPGTPSLQEDVVSCSWRWMVAAADDDGPFDAGDLAAKVAAVLSAPTLVVTRTRKGAPVDEDIRPGIESLVVLGRGSDGTADFVAADFGAGRSGPAADEVHPDGVWLEADLAAQPRSVRPGDVISALGPGLEERHVRRTHQWILRNGARREPLAEGSPEDATEAPHAMERAS